MLKLKVKKKGKKLDSIQQAIRKIDGQSVEIGYFANQGKHIGGDYSYPALAQALETGYFPAQGITRTPMPFMEHIGQRTIYSLGQSTKVKRAFRAWGRKLDKKGNPLNWMNAVGEHAKLQSTMVFNNPAYFPQVPNNKSPLFESGDLARRFTYRTSFDNRVRRT